METGEIRKWIKTGGFQGEPFEDLLMETHISWVVFTKSYAFKIKKPVSLNFADFSTLDKRRYFCEREISLNSRFSSIYLDVLPIYDDKGKLSFDKGELVDYTVRMLRQEHDDRMDMMLAKGKVNEEQIQTLARKLVEIHKKAPVVNAGFNLERAIALFNDLSSVRDVFKGNDSQEHWQGLIDESIAFSDKFLKKYPHVFRKRAAEGFIRDVHGDLHTRNVFLGQEPVIFDCIEFNQEFRQIDIWYELAFLCMDLEYLGYPGFSDEIFRQYTQDGLGSLGEMDDQVFLYFKMLRANIRAKVLLLQAKLSESGKDKKECFSAAIKYLELLKSYLRSKGSGPS